MFGDLFSIVFYQPILNLLVFLYNVIPGHDLGLVIIVLTIIIKLILLPLSKKSLKSQKALQELQPKIEELKSKYKNNKEALGRETMNIYKENKINPLSSCLPLLLQMPFLYAVFMVFQTGLENGSLNLVYPFINRPEAINTISMGFLDLSQKNIIIAVLAGVAQFFQTRMLTAKKPESKTPGAADENMAIMMNKQMLYFMPVMTIFIGMSFPGGLALYWLITTVLTILQQVYLFKDLKGSAKNVIEGEVVK